MSSPVASHAVQDDHPIIRLRRPGQRLSLSSFPAKTGQVGGAAKKPEALRSARLRRAPYFRTKLGPTGKFEAAGGSQRKMFRARSFRRRRAPSAEWRSQRPPPVGNGSRMLVIAPENLWRKSAPSPELIALNGWMANWLRLLPLRRRRARLPARPMIVDPRRGMPPRRSRRDAARGRGSAGEVGSVPYCLFAAGVRSTASLSAERPVAFASSGSSRSACAISGKLGTMAASICGVSL